jgi:hypothetical protein
MNLESKGRSPFNPSQPVPVDLFVGRKPQIERFLRSASQTALGKPQQVYIAGPYGMGKSSLAAYMKSYCQEKYRLWGVHVFLGGADGLEEMAFKTVETMLKTPAGQPSLTEKIRNALAKYIEELELMGVKLNVAALKADSPNLSLGYSSFLESMFRRVQDEGFKGMMLILDEINGIAGNPKFAYFLKSWVDSNAVSAAPLPLLLVLCGVEERRRQMIKSHQPVERIFDIVDVDPLSREEHDDFFQRAFQQGAMTIDADALEEFYLASSGYPKFMHILGNAVFWLDQDGRITFKDALEAIREGALEVGRRFLEPQVYQALRSKEYLRILRAIGETPHLALFGDAFHKSELEEELTESEKKKLPNFLNRMKKLHLLEPGEGRGEYRFSNPLVSYYINLEATAHRQQSGRKEK